MSILSVKRASAIAGALVFVVGLSFAATPAVAATGGGFSHVADCIGWRFSDPVQFAANCISENFATGSSGVSGSTGTYSCDPCDPCCRHFLRKLRAPV
ncbi:MAG: hypothetical protein ABI697_07155 [Devosia sp.]